MITSKLLAGMLASTLALSIANKPLDAQVSLPSESTSASTKHTPSSRPPTFLKSHPLPAPLLLGYGLLGYGRDNVVVFNRRMEKMPEGALEPYLREVGGAIYSGIGYGSYYPDADKNLALGVFITLNESLWEGDTFRPDRLAHLNARFKALTPDSVKDWYGRLYRFSGQTGLPPVSEAWEAAAYLVQIDRVFSPDGLLTGELASLGSRLSGLDPADVEALSKALTAHRKQLVMERQAAILLIQEDRLFSGATLDQKLFKAALGELAP